MTGAVQVNLNLLHDLLLCNGCPKPFSLKLITRQETPVLPVFIPEPGLLNGVGLHAVES